MTDDATEQLDDLDRMHEVEKEVLLQLDGAVDSSDEDEDLKSSEDTGEEDDADEDSDSDLDPDGDSYAGDTENVVVCKYDKISRLRMRWKLKLMDGVMHLNGRDYVFQKAHGEVDW